MNSSTSTVHDVGLDVDNEEIDSIAALFATGFDEIDLALTSITKDVKDFNQKSVTFTYKPSGYMDELDDAFDSQIEEVTEEGDEEGSPAVTTRKQTLDPVFMAQVNNIVSRLDNENEQNKFIIGVLKEKDTLLNDVINRASAVNMIVTRMQRIQSLVDKKNLDLQNKITLTLNRAIDISQELYNNLNIISVQFAKLFELLSSAMSDQLKGYKIRIAIGQKISNQRLKSINTDINYVNGALTATRHITNNRFRALISDVKHEQDSAIQAASHLTILKAQRFAGAFFADEPDYKNVVDGSGVGLVVGFISGLLTSKLKAAKRAKAKRFFMKGRL